MSEEYQIIKTSLGNISGTIYLNLVKNGEMTVPKMVDDLKLSRTIIYEGLTELLADNYVTYRKEGRNAFYAPVHPDKLLDLVAQKKREAEIFSGNIKDTVDSLRGLYNIAMHRPGVRFFEGEAGIREVWWDILDNTNDEFCTISDHESIIKKVSTLNDEWLQEKYKKGIKERIITNESQFNLEEIKKKNIFEEFKFVGKNEGVIIEDVVLDIYPGKIAYSTLSSDNISGVIIENDIIYKLHKNLFEMIWNSL